MLEISEKVGLLIGTIGDAEKYIIEDARNKVLALDWSFAGDRLDRDKINQYFDLSSHLILRQSGLNLPLNLLDSGKPEEAEILEDLSPLQKKQIVENYWLVMLKSEIWPEEATFIRDWLYLKAIDFVAGLGKLKEEELAQHFLADDDIKKTTVRTTMYLARHYPHTLIKMMIPSE